MIPEHHSFHFQAAIVINDDISPDSFCEGALISPNYVLTSGACLHAWPEYLQLSQSYVRVVLGKNEYKGTGEGEKRFTIESRIEFPNFDVFKPFANSFALFKLTEPVKTSLFINYVCLPAAVALDVSAF